MIWSWRCRVLAPDSCRYLFFLSSNKTCCLVSSGVVILLQSVFLGLTWGEAFQGASKFYRIFFVYTIYSIRIHNQLQFPSAFFNKQIKRDLYQTADFLTGFIVLPAGQLKASANSGWFATATLTLEMSFHILLKSYLALLGECGSVKRLPFMNSGVAFVHQKCPQPM